MGFRQAARRLPGGPMSLDAAFDARCNLVGALRLTMALAVVVSHAAPLGYGSLTPLREFSHHQTDLGSLAVIGFFVLSGFLVTRSGMRLPHGRYLWHRALRIFPAFWVCLLVTAFLVAPLVWVQEQGSIDGMRQVTPDAVGYVTQNWTTSMHQWHIGDLLRDTPYTEATGKRVFDGSLWTLRYEVLCYMAVLGLMLFGAVRRQVLVVAAAGIYLLVLTNWLPQTRYGAGPAANGTFDLPVFGHFNPAQGLPLALAFAIGALAAAFPRQFVVDGRLAVVAAAVFLASLRVGGFHVVGILAFSYALIWLALQRWPFFTRVGVGQDWSYGVYIYAFPIQQYLALIGIPGWGVLPYVSLSIGGALATGFVSWHLVEKRALQYKNAPLPRLRRELRIRNEKRSSQGAQGAEPAEGDSLPPGVGNGRDAVLSPRGVR